MKYKTAKEFSEAIDAFIAGCEQGSIPRPTDYRFCVFAGIEPAELDILYLGAAPDEEHAELYREFSSELKKLVRYREDRLIGVIADNPKATSAAVFLLRQKRNGGYTDKKSDDAPGELRINLSLKGADGEDFER